LPRERLGLEVVELVDAEQHDHEEEQHDDRAGVDDDLHRGEEVGVFRHEEHGDAEQRHDQAERGVHRAARDHHADGAAEHDDRGEHEHQRLHQ